MVTELRALQKLSSVGAWTRLYKRKIKREDIVYTVTNIQFLMCLRECESRKGNFIYLFYNN